MNDSSHGLLHFPVKVTLNPRLHFLPLTVCLIPFLSYDFYSFNCFKRTSKRFRLVNSWIGVELNLCFILSAAVIGLSLHLDEHVENKTLDHEIQTRFPFL